MFSTLTLMTALAALTGPGEYPRMKVAAATPTLAVRPVARRHETSYRPQAEDPQVGSQPTPVSPPSIPAPSPKPVRADVVMLERCLVSLIHDLEVTAREDGLLLSVEAREGMHVRKGLQLAQVDDREPKARHAAAVAAHRKAKEEAENDVNYRYAIAAERVAQADYQQAIDANRRHGGSISPAEVRARKLKWDKAALAIEQAKVEQTLAGREADVKAAELEQTTLAIERRKILAPRGGLIVEVKKREGAWVTRGEPLMRMMRMDRLRVAGHLTASQYGPHEVSGRPVSLLVRLERGRTEQFRGKITFVHPEQSGGQYLVWAEVDNRMEGDQWVLGPGLHVDMAIHLQGDAR